MYQKASFFDRKQFWHFCVKAVVGLLGVIAVGFLLVYFFKPFTPVVTIDFHQTPEILHAQTEWIPELPVRLLIPAIEVDAIVQFVGLSEAGTGEMDVPSNFTDVGWYKDGVRPGMKGSAVIAGHFNGKKTPEAVFYDLHTLEVGDEVVIMSAKRIEDIFIVVKVETYDYDASTVDIFLSTDGKKRLNLITCGGEWMPEIKLFDKRTVVFTELLTDVE